MAIIDITTKEFVDELGDNDSIFINYQGTLRQIKKTDLHDNTKLDKNQGSENAEKILTVDNEGNITPSDMPFIPDEVLIDKTLTVDGQAADAKKVGDELAEKADSSSIPIELPNPHKVIFTGSINEEYDGSSEKTINIPEAVNVGNTNITFTEPQQKENINTGESVSTLFGKIKKWLSSLKTVAFTGKYSDLVGTPTTMTGATSSKAGTSGFVPTPASGEQSSFLRGDGTWATPASTTYSQMTGATSSAPGKAGLVPAPSAGSQSKFLRGDGTWNDPTSKIYENKLVTLDEINLVTEPGFFVDALAVKEGFDQLNGNSITEVVTTSSGAAIKYANGLVEEFGQVVCPNINGNVAMVLYTLPVPLNMQKSHAAFCTKDAMGNSSSALRVTTFASIEDSGVVVRFGLQTQNGDLQSFLDKYRTVSWSVKGFWK